MRKSVLFVAAALLLSSLFGLAGKGALASSADSFYMTEITDEIFARIWGKSFKENCTLPREDLRYLHVLHKDLDGNEHEGEMIVNKHIAGDVLEILRQLYEGGLPDRKNPAGGRVRRGRRSLHGGQQFLLL